MKRLILLIINERDNSITLGDESGMKENHNVEKKIDNVKMGKKHLLKLKLFIKLILIIVCIIYIVSPIIIGWYATKRYPETIDEAPKGFDNLSLITSDGVKLSAWYAPSKNGAAIILLHGSTDSRNSTRKYATMLSNNGFGVLLFDMRGHGESGGNGNAYGWKGTIDVGAAIDFLKRQGDIKSIGGLGISMGGEVLLSSASTYPDIQAIISDGATSHSIDDYLILPSHQNLLRSWFTRVMYTSVQIFSRDHPPVKMLDSIIKTQDTKFLFIAAGNLDEEIEYNTCFYENAVQKSMLWIVPDVGHTGAFDSYPKEYEEKIISFYKRSLLEK